MKFYYQKHKYVDIYNILTLQNLQVFDPSQFSIRPCKIELLIPFIFQPPSKKLVIHLVKGFTIQDTSQRPKDSLLKTTYQQANFTQ